MFRHKLPQERTKYHLEYATPVVYSGIRKESTNMRLPKTPFIAVLAGVAVHDVVRASPATLGGLNSTGLGSDNTVVAACDTVGIAIA